MVRLQMSCDALVVFLLSGSPSICEYECANANDCRLVTLLAQMMDRSIYVDSSLRFILPQDCQQKAHGLSIVVGVLPISASANACRLVTLRGPDDGSLDL
jgi:hypothetical protein